MAQLHGIHAGIDAVRPTNDVDIVLHVETTLGVASETARALESLGYELAPSIDERNNTAHRFKRGESMVDVLTSGPDVVDVLVADHAAPRLVEKLRGRTMVAIEGGTQALRRTMNARLQIAAGPTTTVSVPSPFGALIGNPQVLISVSEGLAKLFTSELVDVQDPETQPSEKPRKHKSPQGPAGRMSTSPTQP